MYQEIHLAHDYLHSILLVVAVITFVLISNKLKLLNKFLKNSVLFLSFIFLGTFLMGKSEIFQDERGYSVFDYLVDSVSIPMSPYINSYFLIIYLSLILFVTFLGKPK